MNVGELFIKLGITGAEKTRESLISTKDGLKEVHNSALVMKAAIAGALYGLERLLSSTSQTGTDLLNTSTVLGMSTDTLQQYQYAARNVGASNEEMSGTFKSLQAAMSSIRLGKAPPELMGLASNLLGDSILSDESQIKEFEKYPEKLLMRMQEVFKKGDVSAGFKSQIAQSFGIGPNILSGLERNKFTPQILGEAPKYSEGMIKALDKNRSDLNKIMAKIEMRFGQFNAKHGGELISGLDKITTSVLKLADAFMTLGERVKVFDLIKSSIDLFAAMAESASDEMELASINDDKLRKKKLEEMDKKDETFRKNHPALGKFYRLIDLNPVIDAGGKAIEDVKKNFNFPTNTLPNGERGTIKPAPVIDKKQTSMLDNFMGGKSQLSFNNDAAIDNLLNKKLALNPAFLNAASDIINNTNFNQQSSTVAPSLTVQQTNTFQTAENPKQFADDMVQEIRQAYSYINKTMGA